MNNNLNLLKIITGLNKTVNIAKQVVPIYKQVKPIINKSGEFLKKINKPQIKTEKKSNNQPNTETNTNNPIFFQ